MSCFDENGVPCPVKGKSITECATYDACPYMENMRRKKEKELLEKLEINEELKLRLDTLNSMPEESIVKELEFYQLILDLKQKGF